MCANALDIEPGLRSCADNYAECLPRRNPARPALCMKKRPCAEKGMPHPGRLQQGKQCLSNLFMQRHRAGFLFALHVAFRNVDNFGDFAAVVDVTNPEGQDFVDTEASVDPHQDQSDVAGTVAALAGIKKSGNLIFGQGAAAGVVHKKKILPPKPARFQKLNFAENVKLPLLPKPEVIQSENRPQSLKNPALKIRTEQLILSAIIDSRTALNPKDPGAISGRNRDDYAATRKLSPFFLRTVIRFGLAKTF